jgi:hypothetical protein
VLVVVDVVGMFISRDRLYGRPCIRAHPPLPPVPARALHNRTG